MGRYERIESMPEETTRLCGRNEVNPALSFDEAVDGERFAAQLSVCFGEPAHDEDREADVVAIRDCETGVVFEAYVGPAGPSYAGTVLAYEDFTSDDLRLRAVVIDTLSAFDAWLEASAA